MSTLPEQPLDRLAITAEFLDSFSNALRIYDQLNLPSAEEQDAYLDTLIRVRGLFHVPSPNVSTSPAADAAEQLSRRLKADTDHVAADMHALVRRIDTSVTAMLRRGAASTKVLLTEQFTSRSVHPVAMSDGRYLPFMLGDPLSLPEGHFGRDLVPASELYVDGNGRRVLVLGRMAGAVYEPGNPATAAPWYDAAVVKETTKAWRQRQLKERADTLAAEQRVAIEKEWQWSQSPEGKAATERAERLRMKQEIAGLQAQLAARDKDKSAS